MGGGVFRKNMVTRPQSTVMDSQSFGHGYSHGFTAQTLHGYSIGPRCSHVQCLSPLQGHTHKEAQFMFLWWRLRSQLRHTWRRSISTYTYLFSLFIWLLRFSTVCVCNIYVNVNAFVCIYEYVYACACVSRTRVWVCVPMCDYGVSAHLSPPFVA